MFAVPSELLSGGPVNGCSNTEYGYVVFAYSRMGFGYGGNCQLTGFVIVFNAFDHHVEGYD